MPSPSPFRYFKTSPEIVRLAVLNNRAENFQPPLRRRERMMLWFRRMRKLQKFASVDNHVLKERHLQTRDH